MKEWKTIECNQDYLEENLNWLEKSGFRVHEIFQSKVILNQPEFFFVIVGAKDTSVPLPEEKKNPIRTAIGEGKKKKLEIRKGCNQFSKLKVGKGCLNF